MQSTDVTSVSAVFATTLNSSMGDQESDFLSTAAATTAQEIYNKISEQVGRYNPSVDRFI